MKNQFDEFLNNERTLQFYHHCNWPVALFSNIKDMANLQELESLTVICIVDNECDTMSSGITGITGFEYHSEREKHSGAEQMCLGEHGLSLLLTATCKDQTVHTLLLDAGPTPQLWKDNAEKLEVNMASIEAAVLSHYHHDHAGGLRGAVPAIAKSRSDLAQQPLVVDLHSSKIVSRGSRNAQGEVTPHSPTNPSPAELVNMGALVELHDEPHTVLDGCFYVSGYIPRDTNSYELGMPPSHVTLKQNGVWETDTEIRDERYVACKIKNHGLIVFSSCSHAGINNVCRHARTKLNLPIFGIVGGLHLVGARTEERISNTVSDLRSDIKPSIILGGHCTGWRGKAELAAAFPKNYQPLAVGGTYIFHA